MIVYVVKNEKTGSVRRVFSNLPEAAKFAAKLNLVHPWYYVSDFDVFDTCDDAEDFEDFLVNWYEPNDYPEGDIGSATVAEMRRLNGD